MYYIIPIAYLLITCQTHCFATCLWPSESLIPLCSQLKTKNIYHIRSNTDVPTGWTCGYHALRNMCLIQNQLHITTTTKQNFITTCKKHTTNQKIPSTSQIIETIATDLSIAPLLHLKLEAATVTPLYTIRNITFSLLSQFSQHTLTATLSSTDRLLTNPITLTKHFLNKKHFDAQRKKLLTEINTKADKTMLDTFKAYLANPTFSAGMILCYFTSEGTEHVALISIIKTKTNQSLCIFDNLNLPITTDSPLYTFLEYISDAIL